MKYEPAASTVMLLGVVVMFSGLCSYKWIVSRNLAGALIEITSCSTERVVVNEPPATLRMKRSQYITSSQPVESTSLDASTTETIETTEEFAITVPTENYTKPDDWNTTSSAVTAAREDVDYVSMGKTLLSDASMILDNGIWDFQRETEEGDQIFSRQLSNGNMVYRLTAIESIKYNVQDLGALIDSSADLPQGVVDMPAENLLVIIHDGLGDYPKWNPSLIECRVLEKINDNTDISYTVSAPGARGYVASRDFVSLRHWDIRDKTYIAASRSIDFPGAPSNPDYIRGLNGPGCMELRPLSSDSNKTEFRWLLNTKLNGWIPSYIADKAYKKFMTKYMAFLREYCKKIKQRSSEMTTTPKNDTDYMYT